MRIHWIAAAVGVAVIVVVPAWLLVDGRDSADDETVSGFPTATSEYDGPLYVDEGRYGAAGRALDCPTPAAGQFQRAAVYGEGATSDSVEEALDTANSEGLFLFAPTDGLTLAKAERDRALLTYEVDGRILMALVFRDGPATEGAGGPGWYLESAARCDFAEFPEAFAEKAGYRLWRETDGRPAPVSRIYSAPGPEHCDWQSMEFLHIDERDTYVREPTRDLEPALAGPFRRNVALPGDAQDTGYERDGRHVWLADDGRYVYVGKPGDLEAWPRFDSGCA